MRLRRSHPIVLAVECTAWHGEAPSDCGGAPLVQRVVVLDAARQGHAHALGCLAEHGHAVRGLVAEAPRLDFATREQLAHGLHLLLERHRLAHLLRVELVLAKGGRVAIGPMNVEKLYVVRL